MSRLILLPLIGAVLAAAEPAPRPLTPVPIKVAKPFAHVTAARELANGRILVSDVSTPGLWLLDPVSGASEPIGSPGAGADQYAEPAGFYSGASGTILLADHSGPRALTLTADGKITGGYSTAKKGVRSSSDNDNDDTRLDGRGFAYFVDRVGAFAQMTGSASANREDLVRFDPAKQTQTVIAKLMVPVQRQVSAGNGIIYTRSTIGDPADGWGVVADGRVAIVRASPYRVEWLSPDGKSTLGPVISYEPIPFTEADRAAAEKAAGRGASVGIGGGTTAKTPAFEREYAATKPAFFPNDVIVSPAGRVWVMRTQPFGATTTLYDVFDGAGARIDRVTLPAGSRVIGFGPASVLVREGAEKNAPLRKYRTP